MTLAAPVPRPFKIHVPDAVLDDLRLRLGQVRWPDEPPAGGWNFGTDMSWLRSLVAYWRDGFDWRAQEALLNSFQHFKVQRDGVDLHFIHAQGKGPDALPLLLCHGWPGSVMEFHKLIPMLCDPARFGGDPRDAFTVVAPSLPGYGFSFDPGQRRFGAIEIADTLAGLMTDVLGYERFGTQGGDWGAFVTSRIAADHPESVVGLHLNMLALRREPQSMEPVTPEEAKYQQELAHFLREETGYQAIMGTKPQTLAYALTDSPVGLAAWIGEKFQSWTDCDGVPENAVSRDEMLADMTIYWATGAIGSSMWPYYARMHGAWPVPGRVEVPMGYCAFPREILRPPRSLAEKVYDVRRWTEMPKGGHFAALEQPEALAREVRAFFRELR